METKTTGSMKPNLLILHGALGASEQFTPLAKQLDDHFTVHSMNFEGHGGSDSKRPYRIEYFAENAKKFLDDRGIAAPWVFGYSMGGYAALYLALHHFNIFSGIVALGVKFFWTPEFASSEIKKLQPDSLQNAAPKFAEILKKRHTEELWKSVVEKTAEMMVHLGKKPLLSEDDIQKIQTRLHIGCADGDTMATPDETQRLASLNPLATFFTLPESRHPIEQCNIPLLAEMIAGFAQKDSR